MFIGRENSSSSDFELEAEVGWLRGRKDLQLVWDQGETVMAFALQPLQAHYKNNLTSFQK